ncbi:hypothetical protein EDEG_04145 [Edhazardia aedis USNM 41457]|uniref:Uncharacterized protein n=1 Tax=Edhazardia aedis (strain USNM 41457) TaxID=1003232 RepID=J9DUG7_EDHAE|nr:hypothetical protein EDEG_04145 [Edhazardia aedis USNM 41457]|eukprot:EJW04942.1 hypothetical protein EDEG_04145 [Edhazardia aedis USNM 41457]
MQQNVILLQCLKGFIWNNNKNTFNEKFNFSRFYPTLLDKPYFFSYEKLEYLILYFIFIIFIYIHYKFYFLKLYTQYFNMKWNNMINYTLNKQNFHDNLQN